jgi:hypothetical protein
MGKFTEYHKPSKPSVDELQRVILTERATAPGENSAMTIEYACIQMLLEAPRITPLSSTEGSSTHLFFYII